MKIIAAAGFARSGKNTFIDIVQDILIKNGYDKNRIKQYSFAGQVKAELASFLQNNCNVDVFTDDPLIKQSIRNLLVWYATWWRERDPLHWFNKVESAINKDKNDIDIALISDVRYSNECEFIQRNDGKVIHIKRYSSYPSKDAYGPITNREYDISPNREEAKNDPLVFGLANQWVNWENRNSNNVINDPYLRGIVTYTLNNTKLFSEKLLR